jgi:alpha-L-arabinofuranosidase
MKYSYMKLVLVILVFLAVAGCAADATVNIDNSAAAVQAAPDVNRRVLGSNMQWTDSGDGMLQAGSTSFSAAPLARAVTLAPTMLRYPGGGQADAYDWRKGVGDVRGECMHVFTNAMQTVYFGTDEFLELCALTGAAPMFTLNVVNGTPEDSAAWVSYVNNPPGGSLVARDWEVGNEPYYQNSLHPDWDMTAEEYAAAYNAHAAAVIAADPRIRVGLPLLGPIDASLLPAARRTWNAGVLAGLSEPVDFVAVHDAYLPFNYTFAKATDAQMLQATLAGAPAVADDLDKIRTQLTAAGITAPFAMTEHNALMTLYGIYNPIPRSDGVTCSLAAAVYTVDLICTLAARDDVDSAEHWSLIGNWLFGAMYSDGTMRPGGNALAGLGQALIGRRLMVQVSSPTVNVPAFGAKPAQTAMPLLGAFACGSSGTVRTILLNRSPSRALRVRLACSAGANAGSNAAVRTLNALDPLKAYTFGTGAPDWTSSTAAADAGGVTVNVPAHAVVIVLLPAPIGGVTGTDRDVDN